MADQPTKSYRYILQFIIVGVLIAGAYITFRQMRTSQYVNYVTYFNNIQGLQPSSPVQVNGVRVGKISEITLEDSRLKVTIAIDKDHVLTEGTRASLASGGATGEKIIMLERGTGNGTLAPNAVLVSNMDTSVLPISVRMTPMIESAKLILNSANVGLTGITYLINGGLATQSLEMLVATEKQAEKLEGLATGLNKQADAFAKPLHSARTSTGNMAANAAQIEKSIHELEKTTATASTKPFSANLDTLRTNLSALGKTFKQLKKSKPVTDKEAYNKATQSSGNINQSVKGLLKTGAPEEK